MELAINAINEINEIIEQCKVVLVSSQNIKQALEIYKKYGYRYFDCLMIVSALGSDCKYLITEDMAYGQIVENNLTIINIYEKENIEKYLNSDIK
ncbi:MAG: hypothetical protein Pg6C_06100 [Treponemataceae bacterium]|nr:MAG: hypothetical protein Pg6C_06100 [Treponemataceae bacterium]